MEAPGLELRLSEVSETPPAEVSTSPAPLSPASPTNAEARIRVGSPIRGMADPGEFFTLGAAGTIPENSPRIFPADTAAAPAHALENLDMLAPTGLVVAVTGEDLGEHEPAAAAVALPSVGAEAENMAPADGTPEPAGDAAAAASESGDVAVPINGEPDIQGFGAEESGTALLTNPSFISGSRPSLLGAAEGLFGSEPDASGVDGDLSGAQPVESKILGSVSPAAFPTGEQLSGVGIRRAGIRVRSIGSFPEPQLEGSESPAAGSPIDFATLALPAPGDRAVTALVVPAADRQPPEATRGGRGTDVMVVPGRRGLTVSSERRHEPPQTTPEATQGELFLAL